MDQQLIQTKKGGSVLPPLAAARSRSTSALSKNVHFTNAHKQAMLLSIDTLLLLVALYVPWRLTAVPLTVPDTLVSAGIFLGAWFFFGWLNDLYDVRSVHIIRHSIGRVAVVSLVSLLIVLLSTQLLGVQLQPTFFLSYLSIGLLLVLGWRLIYSALAKTPMFISRVAILGTGKRAQTIANLLSQEHGQHYAVLGFLSETPHADATSVGPLPVWPLAAAEFEQLRDKNVNEIVFAADRAVDPALYATLLSCHARGMRVSSVPTIYRTLCEKVPVEHIDSFWLLEAMHASSDMRRRVCKRTLDLTICLLALPWLLLVVPIIALAIKLDSPGPVFFRQLRTGMGSKTFWILKFRTMFTNAEEISQKREAQDGVPRWTDEDDPRITRVGRLLRKVRFDELPQFFNILRGDMSLIGPRPELTKFVPQMEERLPHFRARLLVPPGLTGWAQVKLGYVNSVDDALYKLQYDIHYVLHWSLWLDLYVLYHTVRVVLRAQGR